jgi:hypothetical protein
MFVFVINPDGGLPLPCGSEEPINRKGIQDAESGCRERHCLKTCAFPPGLLVDKKGTPLFL